MGHGLNMVIEYRTRIGKEYNSTCVIVEKLKDGKVISPKIGKDVWIGHHTVIDGSGGLIIGKGCDISSGAHIYTHDTVKRCTQKSKDIRRGAVSIGHHTFIGANAVILRGVKIGHHCIISAGTTITKNKIIKDNFVAYRKSKLIMKTSNGL